MGYSTVTLPTPTTPALRSPEKPRVRWRVINGAFWASGPQEAPFFCKHTCRIPNDLLEETLLRHLATALHDRPKPPNPCA